METKVFEQRFVSLSPTLYRVAYSLLHNEQDAEDAVQDTLVALWREADRVEVMRSPEGYAMKTLRNRCVDLLRERAQTTEWDEVQEPVEEPDVTAPMDAGDVMRCLLNNLSPKAQTIVRMRHVAECSMQEISHATGIREDNVRQILSRSRKQLCQIYKKIIES